MSHRAAQQALRKFYTGESSHNFVRRIALPAAWSHLQTTPFPRKLVHRSSKPKIVYKIPQKAKKAKIEFNYSDYRKLFKI